MRELYSTEYDSSTYSNEKLLYKTGLIDQVTLSKNLTYLWGKDSDMFPLLTATQGQNAFKSIKPTLLNDTQYVWPVMARMKWTTKVVSLANTSIASPGLNFTPFDVIFEDNWIHYQYSAYTPDQKHQVRFMTEPKQIASNRFQVTVQLIGSDPTEYITADQFAAGKAWAMGATSVAGQLSDGTTSNRMMPGKMTNQFGWQRYSKPIAGNISNKIVNIEFDLEGGGTTNMWLPFELKQWEMERRLLDEIDLWYSKYNRDTNGQITLKDTETGEPIPKGAGVREILRATGNYDTYSVLTKAKFDSTVRAVFDNRVDNTTNEIVLYTGKGGAEMFHNMLMNEAAPYVVAFGDKVVTGEGYLQFGAYFNRYKTIDGRIVTVLPCKMWDQGTLAQQDRENGRMYNGYPLASYTMAFLDHSVGGGGERNITLVAEQGREEISGIYVGLTPLPPAWKPVAAKEQQLSTTKDKASYEVMVSRGINFSNATTSFWLEMTF
jgi:hypothetical protein